MSATRTSILLNESTTLNCSVLSSNPSTFSVIWTLTNTNNITTTLSETEEILVVMNIGEDDFGTYTCNVTNSASLSATAETTIEEGGMSGIEVQCHCNIFHNPVALPNVTVDDVDVALPGDNVTLNCSATGDTPFTFQWTMQDSTAILSTDMTLELMDITEDQFGTYICSVTNALGEGTSNVTIERASEFVFCNGFLLPLVSSSL